MSGHTPFSKIRRQPLLELYRHDGAEVWAIRVGAMIMEFRGEQVSTELVANISHLDTYLDPNVGWRKVI